MIPNVLMPKTECAQRISKKTFQNNSWPVNRHEAWKWSWVHLKHLLQLTASPWTTEASTRERWQFGALTNRKATSSNRDQSLTPLYYYSCTLHYHYIGISELR